MRKSLKVGLLNIRPHVRDGKKTGAWYVDVPPHFAASGKRERPLCESRKAAEELARRLTRECQLTGRLQGRPVPLSGVTFEEIARAWQAAQADRVATRKKRDTTHVKDGYILNSLSGFFGLDDIARIGDQRVVEYQKHRLSAGKVDVTVNSETSFLLQVLKWAQEKGLVERLPKIERIPVHRRRVELPTVEETARIIGAVPRLDEQLLIRTFAETGGRKSEIFGLTWADIDEAYGAIKIRSEEGGLTLKNETSVRDVHVSGDLLRDLRKLRIARSKPREGEGETVLRAVKASDLVFPGRGGVLRTDISKLLRTAVKEAKVTRDGKPLKLTLKVFRKAHATWQALRGIDRVVVKARLGHSPRSRITDEVYVQATPDAQRAAVFAVPQITNTADQELATSGNRAKNKGSR